MFAHTPVATALLASLACVPAGVGAIAVMQRDADDISTYGYATFYDDSNCQDNPGEAVSMGNAGCLANEYGRNSIYVQPGIFQDTKTMSLVWSSGNECDCQNDCAYISWHGGHDYCWNLITHAPATSFRFIEQGCAANNC